MSALARIEAREAAASAAPRNAWADVRAERVRQVDVEGHAPDRDDAYHVGQLARGAIAYLMVDVLGAPLALIGRVWWPWPEASFKPRSRRENLVRAGALVLAEIERLDRAEIRS